MKGAIDLRFTAELRSRIEAFLREDRSFPPTLVLLKGREEPGTVDEWMYNAYGPDNISGLEPRMIELGKPLLYDCDGLTVAIPQFQFIHELEGRTLGAAGRNRLVVLGGDS
jgi:hypothetical protein